MSQNFIPYNSEFISHNSDSDHTSNKKKITMTFLSHTSDFVLKLEIKKKIYVFFFFYCIAETRFHKNKTIPESETDFCGAAVNRFKTLLYGGR